MTPGGGGECATLWVYLRRRMAARTFPTSHAPSRSAITTHLERHGLDGPEGEGDEHPDSQVHARHEPGEGEVVVDLLVDDVELDVENVPGDERVRGRKRGQLGKVWGWGWGEGGEGRAALALARGGPSPPRDPPEARGPPLQSMRRRPGRNQPVAMTPCAGKSHCFPAPVFLSRPSPKREAGRSFQYI